MRDALIGKLCDRMESNGDIFFLSGDLGAPTLDELRNKYPDRFINVGIAEQNLVNISAGLALEGFSVYAYAIVPFLTMRAYEQIKNNLSLTSEIREMNINLIGVGAGISYDISGPSHHGIEDLCIINLLPNMVVFSPSDWVLTDKFVDYSLMVKKPKYARLDSKSLPKIYDKDVKIDFKTGFCELKKGDKTCIVSTGFMTHKAIEIAKDCMKERIDIGVLDVFLLKPLNSDKMSKLLEKYECVITMEEGFINKGGLDTQISNIVHEKEIDVKLTNLGFKDEFVFDIGGREYIHKKHNLDKESVINLIHTVEHKLGK
jgi:transketolase